MCLKIILKVTKKTGFHSLFRGNIFKKPQGIQIDPHPLPPAVLGLTSDCSLLLLNDTYWIPRLPISFLIRCSDYFNVILNILLKVAFGFFEFYISYQRNKFVLKRQQVLGTLDQVTILCLTIPSLYHFFPFFIATNYFPSHSVDNYFYLFH